MTTLNSGRRAGFLLRLLALLALVSTAVARPQAAHATSAVCYVDGAAGGLNNGTSWTDSYSRLQAALSCSGEVWVKAGLYTPADFKGGPNRTDTYNFPAGLAVYGGFAGTETMRSQRDPAVNVTILSGDLFGDDTNLDGNHIDETAADIQGSNSYHVVTMDGTSTDVTNSTVLDGFTVTGGENEGDFPLGDGGGLYCNGSGAGNVCSPTLANLNFSGNLARLGGAIFDDGESGGTSSPTLTNVTFHGNYAPYGGGAIYDYGVTGISSPTLTNVTFSNNLADHDGGGMYNAGTGAGGTSSPMLVNVTFASNSASLSGGAIYNYGENLGNSSPTLDNLTFAGNQAIDGGAMYNYSNNGVSSPIMSYVTFNGNTALHHGGALYNDDGGGFNSPTLSDVILWGDTATIGGPEIYNIGPATPNIDHSDVQGSGGSGGPWDSGLGIDGGGNLDADPMLGPLASNGGFTETMALLSGSPAIDAGKVSICDATDQRGVTRPQGLYCDIGAYEYEGDHVNVYAGGSLEGTHLIPGTWAQQHNYPGVNSGPAEAVNTNGGSVVSSIRVLFGGSSYSEMMGYPNNTTTDFWFPWYNNTAFDSQFRVSNLGGSSTTITVSLGGSTIDSFSLGAGAAIRKNYAGQNSGPMHVSSSGGVPILSTIRVLYGGSSYSEMMGFPNNASSDFYFPWYNNVAMDSQFRVSNLGAVSTTITVSLAGSPIDSFTLPAGAAIRKNYAGQNNGPMHVYSSATPILATIRVLFGGGSYSEMMGFPNVITADFWFPWYNDVAFDSQFRVSNLGLGSTTITVSLAGTPIDSFTLGAGTAIRKNYASQNNGAFHITSSGEPILATVRVLYAGTSFYEVMGYPGNALTSTQYFPWYNNTAFNSQMRIAVP